MLSINSNTQATILANFLNRLTNDLSETSLRVATGKRILTAADDPAGIAIVNRLKTEFSSYGAVQKNISFGTSLLETSATALDTASSLVGELRSLAVEAANDTLSADQRTALQNTFAELQGQIDDVVNGATIFGQNLVGATAANVNIQSGINAGDTTTVNAAASDTATLAIDAGSIDVTTSANASAAITALDTALNTIGSNQAIIGAQQKGLEVRSNNVGVIQENLTSAISRIEDADISEETTKLALLQTRQQMAIGMLGLVNSFPQNALALLR